MRKSKERKLNCLCLREKLEGSNDVEVKTEFWKMSEANEIWKFIQKISFFSP